MVWLVLACTVQGGKCPWVLADHLVLDFLNTSAAFEYQRSLVSWNRKEENILVSGTNIPADWHHSHFCNVSDNSSDHKRQQKVPGDLLGEASPSMEKGFEEAGILC